MCWKIYYVKDFFEVRDIPENNGGSSIGWRNKEDTVVLYREQGTSVYVLRCGMWPEIILMLKMWSPG